MAAIVVTTLNKTTPPLARAYWAVNATETDAATNS